LYAGLCRRLADDPRVTAIARDLRWDFPLRLLGGLHYLVLGGEASWDDVDGALERQREFLTRFSAEQPVQTNEVQRAWALLPGLLSAGAARIDLVELGASAGLLLALDRYAYRYSAGSWGSGEPVLTGEDKDGPPASLLSRPLEVVRRRGIDLDPVDVTTPEGQRLLEAFVWPDQLDRRERLHAAIAAVRRDPPELLRGDYVELLPAVLRDRRPGALTVVMTSVSTVYLDEERYQRLLRLLSRTEAPLAWLALEGVRHDPDYRGVALDLTVWPGGEKWQLARVDHHAAWLEWEAA
jgi:hypothetical protein